MPLLRSYAVMLPRLQAEESLTHISDGMVASGQVKKAAVRRHTRDLQRQLGRRKGRPADPNRLRSAGIQVEHRTLRGGGDR